MTPQQMLGQRVVYRQLFQSEIAEATVVRVLATDKDNLLFLDNGQKIFATGVQFVSEEFSAA